MTTLKQVTSLRPLEVRSGGRHNLKKIGARSKKRTRQVALEKPMQILINGS